MSSLVFPEHELRDHALPAIIEAGRKCFSQGRVREIYQTGNDIIAQVTDEPLRRVVLTRHPQKRLQFACSCGFSLGCVCEHAVAVMLAANAQQAIQTGMDFSAQAPSPLPSALDGDPRSEEFSVGDEGAPRTTEVEVVTTQPVGRLYLSEHETTLLVELRFSYRDGTVEFARGDPPYRLVPANGRILRIERSRARENALTANIMDSNLRSFQQGIFTPNVEARTWISEHLPRLAGAGFEVYGQDRLTSSRIRTNPPRLRISTATEGDLLTCEVTVTFADIPAALACLIAAVRDRSRYVLLSDGSTGLLPREWLERLTAVFAVGQVAADGQSLKLGRSQRPVADLLREMAGEGATGMVRTSPKAPPALFEGVRKREAPQGFAGQMRPYQHAGYEWFYFLQECGVGGCLADDMGLGKTVQALALLLNERRVNCRRRPSLIVVPTSLLFNWEREARRFAPGLVVMKYHGPDRKRHPIDTIDFADIVVTTYGTVLRDLDVLKLVRFNYIILDEAQVIKSPLSHISRAVRDLSGDNRLALSGTPIENNLSELWSLFTFLNPGLLGAYPQFSNAFARPIERDGNCASADILRRMIFPFVLRRTKRQVAPELPPKIETRLCADMLPRQRMVYEATRDLFRSKVLHAIDRDGLEGSRMQLLEALLRLRQICCHPCLMDAAFCGDSGKFVMLDSCIDEAVAGGHKVLVFSQFVKALAMVDVRLKRRGIASETLTGQTSNRAEVVDRFQGGTGGVVFLISLKAGGTGLNLTSADYVIHLDPWWNPAAEDQASDRAYRIGQTRTVFVYKLIMRGSIEERVIDLQESKRKLVQQIIGTEASFFKELSRTDIEGLFS